VWQCGCGGYPECYDAFVRRSALTLAACAALAALASPLTADADPPRAGTVQLDRVVVRWNAPETGGVGRPQFVFERELAFEARIEALAGTETDTAPFRDRHVRAALDRHVAETLLANLPIVPTPSPAEIAGRAEQARGLLEHRARGRARLIAAAAAEGIGSDELDALLRRQAKASLYLDKMVAPMLEPSEPELREVFQTGATPFEGQPFDKALPLLKRWYVGQKMSQAIDAYYQNARSRVAMVIIRAR